MGSCEEEEVMVGAALCLEGSGGGSWEAGPACSGGCGMWKGVGSLGLRLRWEPRDDGRTRRRRAVRWELSA